METSDSEHFESADESLNSDEEPVLTNSFKNLGVRSFANKDAIKDSGAISKQSCSENFENKKGDSQKLVKSRLSTKLGKKVEVTNMDAKNVENNDVPSKEANSLTSESENVKGNQQSNLSTTLEQYISKKDHHEALEVTKDSEKERQGLVSDKEENLWEDDDDWGNFEDNSTLSRSPVSEVGILHKLITRDPLSSSWSDDELDATHRLGEKSIRSRYNAAEDRWEYDAFEPIDPASEELLESLGTSPKQNNNSGWGGWGNWGVSSILSTATQLTSNVSKGLSTVIGVPDPEELARINKKEEELLKEVAPEDPSNSSLFGFGNFVSGVTKIVETTGNKVITSGLDTLETIGKKTMEVLQEGDPGLKKKRAFLKIDQDRPVLSQLLREAKEKAEQENRELQQKHKAKKPNYESIFDDHQGLVHLEALEMLSKQCDIKLQTLLETHFGSELKEMQETLEQVKELCEIPDEDEDETPDLEDIKQKLETAVEEINLSVNYGKVISTWEEADEWLQKLNLSVCDEHELHQQAIETLAQLTALAVEQFHKMGELLLVKEHRSTADEADSLVQLTTALTSLIGIAAAKFSDKLNTFLSASQNKEEINSLITNIFFEAANSSSYIQDAFQLLIPVLQVGAV